MNSVYERFRPRLWSEVIGQDKVLAKIETIRRINGSLAGQCWWITGASGTGKSTIGRLIASEVADDWATEEINGADVGLDTIRQWEERCRCHPLGKGQHCFIINEAHQLSSRVVSRLLTTLELTNVQATSTWIFTTTTDGALLFDGNFDSAPFLSRAIELTLTRQALAKPFAARLREIAGELQLDGQPIERYVRLVQDCKNNFRQALQRIVAGEMLQ